MKTITNMSLESLTALEQLASDTNSINMSSKYDTGPLFQLGNVSISERAWEQVPGILLSCALDAHQCGIWGTGSSMTEMYDLVLDDRENDYITRGIIMSFWSPPSYPPFYIQSFNGKTLVYLIEE